MSRPRDFFLASPTMTPILSTRIVADTANYSYAPLACVKERLGQVAANRNRDIGLLGDQPFGQRRNTRQIAPRKTVEDIDGAAIDETVLGKRVFQGLIGRPK